VERHGGWYGLRPRPWSLVPLPALQ